MHPTGPLSENILGGQVKHLLQGFIGRENALSLGYFPQLPVVTLDHVGGVDDLPDLRWILEEGRDF